MNLREQCMKMLQSVPENKLGYVLAYLQGISAGSEEEYVGNTVISAGDYGLLQTMQATQTASPKSEYDALVSFLLNDKSFEMDSDDD